MKFQLRNVRLGFFDLWKPKSIRGSAEKFSATLIASEDSEIRVTMPDGAKKTFPLLGDDPKKMVIWRLIGSVISEKWPALTPKAKAKLDIWCWNKADGSTTRAEYTNDEGDYYGGFDAETWYATAAKRADKAPDGIQILDQKRRPIGEASGKIYSGCYVNVILDVYANEQDGDKTVSASLEGVQLLRAGERLGFTPTDAAIEFDDEELPEGEDEALGDDDDIYGGTGGGAGDDEIPF